MITAEVEVREADGTRTKQSPDPLFADDGACLHYGYTTLPEARRVIVEQWLGSPHLTVAVRLRGRAGGRAIDDRLSLAGERDDHLAMLRRAGIPDGHVGLRRKHQSGHTDEP